MKRLPMMVTMALLCVAGVGLDSAATIASETYRSTAAWRSSVTSPSPSTSTTPLTTLAGDPGPTPPDHVAAAAKVTQAMHAVLPTAQVGFAVFDRQNDTVLTSHNAGQRFASMSLVKLLIALDTLTGDNGKSPDVATQQQLHQMLADSNDGIASNLWAASGGPAIVTRMVGLLGLTGTQPPENPGRWGDTLTTPQDLVTVYRYITDQLPSSDRDLVLAALSNAPQRAEDGFDQYFGIPDGMPHTTWAVKQGWGTSGSQAVMNSTGLVGTGLRYVVVVLASASAKSYSTVPDVVTAGASALADVVCPASS